MNGTSIKGPRLPKHPVAHPPKAHQVRRFLDEAVKAVSSLVLT